MGFSRQEYWNAFPSPGDLLDPGIEPGFPALQADYLPFEPQESHIEIKKTLNSQENLFFFFQDLFIFYFILFLNFTMLY